MPLTAGARLGPYEILALIGAGGMGEVYRARDTKLKRDVALKVLPEAFARDPERMARFQREAEVLASLNHPNIAAIYGVEDHALVMELVEGLEPKGPLPFDEVWHIASQMAAALEYAHDKGIVHRDLKPANIKVTPEGVVKLLDFGLAKAFTNPRETPTSAGENSPTLTIAATEVGMILGTAAYMSPEQAKGKSVDKRADIWAFGVVLYEMLTGKRLFQGEDVGETLASVIKEEPKWDEIPAKAQHLLKSCLEKDPKKRLRDIGDAERLLMEEKVVTTPITAPSSSRRGKLGWIIAGLLGVGFAGASWVAWRATRPGPAGAPPPLMRLSVDLGPEAVTGNRMTAAISPDATRIAFPVGGPGGRQTLATRLLDQATPTVLSGTDNAADPFFSPDGQWIGFFADGKLKKISVLGGSALTLCDAPNSRGASWGEDGNIIATLNWTSGTGLSRIPASGGTPQTLTKPLDKGELTHGWPKLLPGGNAVLFAGSATITGFGDANIEVLSLKTGETKILLRGGYFPAYIPASSGAGQLIYLHEGVLFGVAFDPLKLELRGTPTPLLEDVAGDGATGGGQLDVSRTGMLVYLSGKSSNAGWPVMWMESSGKTQPLLAKPGIYRTPRFSPDGDLLALSVNTGKGYDIYVYDWHRDTMPRLTFTGRSNGSPVWTPDGKHIVYGASDGLWWVRADGASEPQRLLESKTQVFGNSFSPDGKRLSYVEISPETRGDILLLPLDLSDPEHPKPGKPEPFLRTPANEAFGIFSPDGRWMAHTSEESGQTEVYVRPFPGPGGKWQISSGGGWVPVWSRNGRELFFATLDNRIMVTEYAAKGESFSFAKPRLWSDMQMNATSRERAFDLHPDGRRFGVFLRPEASNEKQGSVHVNFLLNFFDEVRRRVPASK